MDIKQAVYRLEHERADLFFDRRE